MAEGTEPICWSIVAGHGNLPPTLSLDRTGLISGTPTMVGTYNFRIKATNTAGSYTKDFSIDIAFTEDILTGGYIRIGENVFGNGEETVPCDFEHLWQGVEFIPTPPNATIHNIEWSSENGGFTIFLQYPNSIQSPIDWLDGAGGFSFLNVTVNKGFTDEFAMGIIVNWIINAPAP